MTTTLRDFDLVDRTSLARLASPATAATLPSQRPVYEATKRIFDLTLAVVASVVAIPLLLLAAVAIKVSSPGPVLYRHTRVGRYGQPFTCFKLRTMVDGAEDHLEQEEFRARFVTAYKLHHDPRVTSVGKFLRRTSLDELPQLFNVLRGEMSVVGPRPVLEDELKEMYAQYTPAVLSVPPGLTGLWQVSGRSSLPYERRVTLDMDYVHRRSFALDLWIVLQTPIILLLMRGAV
jgi:exopolysaccharide production protein ExoY